MTVDTDTIIAISGSSRSQSSNEILLKHMQSITAQKDIHIYDTIHSLPLFSASADCHPWPDTVLDWRKIVANCSGLVICTPEYLHNLPASIKNALEWLASSGELYGKKVLPVTFTPAPTRGEKAMQSLIWSLEALNAQIVSKLDLYRTDIKIEGNTVSVDPAEQEMISAALELL